jgi:hypothetical protein
MRVSPPYALILLALLILFPATGWNLNSSENKLITLMILVVMAWALDRRRDNLAAFCFVLAA